MSKPKEPPKQFGPEYPDLGPAVAKFRRKARSSIYDLTREERVAYADAIEKSIRAKQRLALIGTTPQLEGPPRDIGATIRGQHRAALAACPSQERRARTPRQWQEMYEQAMAEKAKALEAPKPEAPKPAHDYGKTIGCGPTARPSNPHPRSAAALKAWQTRRAKQAREQEHA